MKEETRRDESQATRDPALCAEVIAFDQLEKRARMNRIKRSIAQGTYQPDLDALADSLLSHSDFYQQG